MIGVKKNVSLTERRLVALKELFKEENIKWIESGYGGNRFGFPVSKEWYEKYQDLLSYSDENFNDISQFENNLCKYVKMICWTQIISKETAYFLGLNENHIKMIRRSYFDFDTDFAEGEDDINFKGVLYLAYKRPFGNSNVIGDVLEEYDISQVDENDDYIEKDWDTEYADLLQEVVEKIKSFLINAPFDSDLSATYDGYHFEPSVYYLRKYKIEKLLNE